MRKFVNPSRPDAYSLNRNEKQCVTFLMNVVSSLLDAQTDLKDRVAMIDGGEEMLKTASETSLKLLEEVRRTIPEKQRTSLNNTAHEYELRLVPKLTPGKNAVVVSKEVFRELVDAAQAKCRDCVDDSEEAKKCKLYEVLVTALPLDFYPDMGLCPYNMAKWEN